MRGEREGVRGEMEGKELKKAGESSAIRHVLAEP